MEGQVLAGVLEVEDDLLFFAFEGAGGVGLLCPEGLYCGSPLELILFFSIYPGLQVPLLSALDDGSGRESKPPTWADVYLAMSLARVNTVLIILQITKYN